MDFALLTHEDVPKTLYHYTSLEALLSIAQSKRLRASNIRFLNDRTESVLLKESVVEILQRRTSSEDEEMVSTIIDLIETHPAQSTFVASLSEKSDLLSQWRAYCPSGLGVSIGFSSEALGQQWIRNPSDDEQPYFLSSSLQKIRYYGKAHEQALEEMVERLLAMEREGVARTPSGGVNTRVLAEVIPIVKGSPDRGELDPLMKLAVKAIKEAEGKPFSDFSWSPGSTLAAWALILSRSVKHDAFEEECEWRKLVSKDNRLMPGQMFRQGKSTLIPFVEVMLDAMSVEGRCVQREKYFIDEVIIGPTPTPHLTEEALRSLFSSEGHPEVKIRPSRIPFKDW